MKVTSFAAYRRWWTGMFSASVGRYAQLVVLGSHFALTDGVLLSALVAAATFGPGVVGAPLGGVAADRYCPRTVVLVGAAVQVLAGLGLVLTLLGGLSPVLALICIAIQGFGLAFSSPASALLLQASVPDQALEQAIGGGGLGSELGRFLGAVAGWVLLGGRPVAAVFGNIASLLVLMGAYRSLPTNPRPGRSTTRARQPNCQVSPLSRVVRPVADGHVAQRWVRGALGGIVLVHLLAFPYLGLAPARAAAVVDPDRVSAWAGAMLSVAGLAAALSSAYFAQRVRRDQARSTLAWSSLLAGGALALWGVVDHPYFAVALVAAVAATAQLYLMCCTVLIHTHTRPDARGRVLGLSRALTDVCYAGALAGQGYAVQRFGFGSLAAVGGVFAVAGFLTAMGTRAPGSR